MWHTVIIENIYGFIIKYIRKGETILNSIDFNVVISPRRGVGKTSTKVYDLFIFSKIREFDL